MVPRNNNRMMYIRAWYDLLLEGNIQLQIKYPRTASNVTCRGKVVRPSARALAVVTRINRPYHCCLCYNLKYILHITVHTTAVGLYI